MVNIIPGKLPLKDKGLTAQMPNLSFKELRKICSTGPNAIGKKYGLTYYPTKDGGYWYKDNGANVLAVAHLDSVKPFTHFDIARLRPETLIFAPNLDDRLGAHILLDYLPKIKTVKYDILLTLNEENGASTAADFVPPKGKKYDWMFMFDRIGTGCTVYNYRGTDWELALDDASFSIHKGSYSCIVDLEHLGCKGVNFGIGYHDNHSDFAVAYKSEVLHQIRHFLQFYDINSGFNYEHKKSEVMEYYAARYGKNKPEAKTKNINRLPVISGPKPKPSTAIMPASVSVAKKLGKDLREYLDKTADAEISKLERIKNWKIKKEREKKETAQTLVNTLHEKTFDRIQTSLITDLGVLPIPWDVLHKLYDQNILYVGEVACLSKVDLLNMPKINKKDVNMIRKALKGWDLDLNTNLEKYNISITILKGRSELTVAHSNAIDLDNANDDRTKSLSAQVVPMPVKYTDPDTAVFKDIDVEKSIATFRKETGVLARQINPVTISMTPIIKGRIKAALPLNQTNGLKLMKVRKKWVWLTPVVSKSKEEPIASPVGFSHLRLIECSIKSDKKE